MRTRITELLVAVVIAGLALLAVLGVHLAAGAQALAVGIITAIAGLLAPAIRRFQVTRYARELAAAAAAALTGINILFASNVVHMGVDLRAAIITLLAAVAALFVPAVAHPTTGQAPVP